MTATTQSSLRLQRLPAPPGITRKGFLVCRTRLQPGLQALPPALTKPLEPPLGHRKQEWPCCSLQLALRRWKGCGQRFLCNFEVRRPTRPRTTEPVVSRLPRFNRKSSSRKSSNLQWNSTDRSKLYLARYLGHILIAAPGKIHDDDLVFA